MNHGVRHLSARRRGNSFLPFAFCLLPCGAAAGLSGDAAACELNVAVDAVDDDRRAARTNLGAEVIAFEFAHHGDVRHVRIDAAIDAGHFDISIEVFGELNLDAAVDAADVYAALAQAHNVDFNTPVDAADIGIADCLSDFDCAIDAVELNGAFDCADRHAPVDAADAQINLARQAQRH